MGLLERLLAPSHEAHAYPDLLCGVDDRKVDGATFYSE